MSQPSSKPKKPPKNAEPVESCGETWWLSEVTTILRRQFARPIRMRARQALIDDKETMDEDAYAEEWDALQGRIDAGAYDWGPPLELGGTGPGRAIKAVLSTEQGLAELLRVLLAEAHGDLTPEKAAEILGGNPEGVTAALRAAMGLPSLPPDADAEPGETATTETKPTTTTTTEPAAATA